MEEIKEEINKPEVKDKLLQQKLYQREYRKKIKALKDAGEALPAKTGKSYTPEYKNSYAKKYYEETLKKTVECPCGKHTSKQNLRYHLLTKTHKHYEKKAEIELLANQIKELQDMIKNLT